MKRCLPLLIVLLGIFGATPSYALFGSSESRRMVSELEERVNTQSRSQLELANQLEMLRAENARLRGQVEVLQNEVESLQQRQRDFYVDLDSRLRRFEGGEAVPQGPADPVAESQNFEAALTLLKQNKNREALSALQTFIATYPGSEYVPGAHFWAGTAAMQMKDFSAANRHFNTILNQWPSDPWAADALLGIANSQRSMGDSGNSRRTLQSLIERYPDSNAAQEAQKRLNR